MVRSINSGHALGVAALLAPTLGVFAPLLIAPLAALVLAVLLTIRFSKRRGRAWIDWAPAAGVTAAALVAVVMWTGSPPADELMPSNASTDIEILFTEDSFEMLEDLEFYSWIELDEETDETLQPGGHVG